MQQYLSIGSFKLNNFCIFAIHEEYNIRNLTTLYYRIYED